jgi:hypothetical protein
MVCKICSHQNRLEIDREIVAGQPHTKIGKKYGVTNQSVRNHAARHLSRQLLQSYERKGRLVSDELVDQFEGLFVKARELHEKSLARDSLSGDNLALRALGEQRAILDTMCRIMALLVEAKSLEEAQKPAPPVELDISDFSVEEKRALVNAYRRKRFGDEIPPCHVAETVPKRHIPAPRTLPENDFKLHTDDEMGDPCPNIPEIEIKADAEPEPETLPPAPTREIQGSTRGKGLVNRHKMARAETSRPTVRREPDPLPFFPKGD